MLESNTKDPLLKRKSSQLLDLLDSRILLTNPKVINFYKPNVVSEKRFSLELRKKFFQTYSITGNNCRLNCSHCQGKILKTMKPTNTPNKLLEAAIQLKEKGGIGCLISGGSEVDGSISFEPFIPIIKQIKKKLGLTVFVHTGFINLKTAKELKKAKVDLALIDIIGSKKTIAKLNIKAELEDYIKSLKALKTAKLQFVPHVIVGLDNKTIENEFKALKIISTTQPNAIVIIGFIPIIGTIMGKNQPGSPQNIAKVLVASKLLFPNTPIALGCMRQRGKNRKITELYALKSGISAIALPTKDTINYAINNGYKIKHHHYCCAQIYKDYIPKL
jgi:uncharacterized radical SAM superfamily protein